MSYCTSCGSPIPDGQGNSCSMCYGDVEYGQDKYYEKWIEEQIELERLKEGKGKIEDEKMTL